MTTETVKHTPGPWILETCEDGSMAIVPRVGFGVARVDYEAGQPAIANGLLLAAAPDLRVALRMLGNAASHARELLRSKDGYAPMEAAEVAEALGIALLLADKAIALTKVTS